MLMLYRVITVEAVSKATVIKGRGGGKRSMSCVGHCCNNCGEHYSCRRNNSCPVISTVDDVWKSVEKKEEQNKIEVISFSSNIRVWWVLLTWWRDDQGDIQDNNQEVEKTLEGSMELMFDKASDSFVENIRKK